MDDVFDQGEQIYIGKDSGVLAASTDSAEPTTEFTPEPVPGPKRHKFRGEGGPRLTRRTKQQPRTFR